MAGRLAAGPRRIASAHIIATFRQVKATQAPLTGVQTVMPKRYAAAWAAWVTRCHSIAVKPSHWGFLILGWMAARRRRFPVASVIWLSDRVRHRRSPCVVVQHRGKHRNRQRRI